MWKVPIVMRRVLAVVLAGLAATALAVAPQADAANPFGSLQVRSVGSAYSASSGVVSAAVAAGSPATFSLKVVNPGGTVTDYRLRVAVSPIAVIVVTSTAGSFGKRLVAGPDGYPIAAVPAHGSKVLTVSVTPPTTSPQLTFTTLATLATVSGTDLDSATLLTEIKAPAKGHTAYTMLVSSSAGGPAVGGDTNGQTVTGGAIGVNGSTTFKVVLRNDSAATTTVRLRTDFQYCDIDTGYYNANIFAGSSVVSPDLYVDTQSAGYPVTLAKGATKTFQLVFKRDDTYKPPCAEMGGAIWTTSAANDGPRVSVRVLAHPAV